MQSQGSLVACGDGSAGGASAASQSILSARGKPGRVKPGRVKSGPVRPNAFLLKSAIAASLGGLLFGFDTAVIAGTTRSLTALYHLSASGLGLTVSSALFGTIPGAMFAGMLGDRFGRRDCLRLLGLLYLISALGCALAPDWYSLLCFRFFFP